MTAGAVIGVAGQIVSDLASYSTWRNDCRELNRRIIPDYPAKEIAQETQYVYT